MTWLNSIFQWFYCLKLSEAVLLIAGVSVLFLLLSRRFGGRKAWRVSASCLLLIVIAAILWVTVWSRTSDGTEQETILIPFISYYKVLTGGELELLRSNFMNVILFYPAGLFACELLPRRWSEVRKVILVTVLFAVASAGIEFCQYRFALGQAEIDDVIHNALGAMIGAAINTKLFEKK